MPGPYRPVWLPRLSGHTLRTQVALLYTAVFFASSLALLAVPFLTAGHTVHAGSGGGMPAVAPPGNGVQRFVAASAVSLAVTAVLALVSGWVIAGRLLRPLRTITATARAISASSLHHRLRLGGRSDELRELGETLDDLFARLEAAFESQRRFVASASHELRTPLTAERTVLQVALADPQASVATLRSACEQVLALGRQQELLIGALLTLASSERGIGHREPFDLAGLAATAIADRRDEAIAGGIEISADLRPATASGDPALAACLIANLLDNAIRHNVSGGRAAVTTHAAGGHAVISVTNTGAVVPPGEVDRLFEPFQQLGGDHIRRGGGHGLGLAIVAAIARAHGAPVTARARPRGGLAVSVSFPHHT